MRSLLLLGSTGSIGTQTLDLVRRAPERYSVVGLVAGSSWEALLEQAREFRPTAVAIADPIAGERLAAELPAGIALRVGPRAAEELSAELDYEVCMHGLVGAAGLVPSVRVLERGRVLALANKESMVVAGELLKELEREHGGSIVPVDSEHSAIFQCLRGEDIGRVRRVILTASGGPFRDLPLDEFSDVTPDRALCHPNWDMGPRVTIGSATLMNKALEVVEAHHLFGLERERIAVAVHRQSIVHSMVEFVDGSVIAQMGPPDMRGPIHYALHHPDRTHAPLDGFGFELFRELSFEEPDAQRFPALELGFDCIEHGGDAGCVLNAADEVAVEAFLNLEIPFQGIHKVNRSVLGQRPGLGTVDGPQEQLERLLASDAQARVLARGEVAELATSPAS